MSASKAGEFSKLDSSTLLNISKFLKLDCLSKGCLLWVGGYLEIYEAEPGEGRVWGGEGSQQAIESTLPFSPGN